MLKRICLTLLLGNCCGHIKCMGSKELPDLSIAAANGDIELVQSLLSSGADVNQLNVGGYSALDLAIFYKQEAMVRFLLDHGAHINKQNQFGQTPLHRAIFVGYKAIIRLLLSRGANIDQLDSSGITPLELALRKGDQSIIDLLVRYIAHLSIFTLAEACHPRLGVESTANKLPFDGSIQKTIFDFLIQSK